MSNPFVDLRREMNNLEVTIERQYSIRLVNKPLVFLGLRFIEFGCWLCGMRFNEQ